MKTEIAGGKNYRITLDDRSEFFYSIRPFEITNALGAVVAVLDEYFITSKSGKIFKLYRTKEGNWYDVNDLNFPGKSSKLREMKMAIDSKISNP